MWSGAERGVNFVANVVTIIAFIAAVVSWLGFDVIPTYRPPTENVANALVIVFTLMASFGIGNLLGNLAKQEKPTVLLSLLLTLVYCFTFVWVRMFLTEGFETGKKQVAIENASHWGMGSYLLCIIFLYVFRFIYPRGLTFGEWLKGGFRLRTWQGAGIALLMVVIVPYLIRLFGDEVNSFK